MREQLKNDKSGRDALQALAIVSAYRTDVPTSLNQWNHALLLERLRGCGIHCVECDGMYDGVQEKSVLVELRPPLDWGRVIQAGYAFSQESVLYIDKDRQATLVFLSQADAPRLSAIEREVPLGELVAVSPTKAQTLNAWTKTNDGQYYAIL